MNNGLRKLAVYGCWYTCCFSPNIQTIHIQAAALKASCTVGAVKHVHNDLLLQL